MARQPVAEVRIASCVVNCVPESIQGSYHWAITVADRGNGRRAVERHGEVLSSRGGSRARRWDIEPHSSARTDAWLRSHRFSHDKALRQAKKRAPLVQVNGMAPADVIAHAHRP